MCGMCGAVSTGPLSSFELKNVQKLAFLNVQRGTDQGGMMFRKRGADEKTWFIKDDDDSFDFIKSTLAGNVYQWDKVGEVAPIMVACHLRAATRGKVSKKNCHPFHHGRVIGMHNGTVSNGLKHEKLFDTDSEAIYKTLAEDGLQEAIDQIHSHYGAAALVWVDLRDQTLNFWRNSLRPLHFYCNSSTLYFSSDAKDLMYVFDKVVKTYDVVSQSELDSPLAIPKDGIKEFATHKHYKISIEDPSMEWIVSDATPKSPVSYNYGGAYNRGWFRDAEYAEWSEYERPSRSVQRSTNNVVRLPPPSNTTEFCPIYEFRNPPVFLKELSRMRAAEWRRTGRKKEELASNESRNIFYAVEFDAYYYGYEYNRLMYWRAENPTEFLSELRKTWSKYTQAKKSEVCKILGMSRKQMNKLTSFKDNAEQTAYIYDAWVLDKDGEIIYNTVLAKYYEDEEKEFEKQKQTVANRILKPLEDNINVLYGASKKVCTITELKEKMKKGCGSCSNPVVPTEDIFWIDDNDFLCEKCQEHAAASDDHVVHTCYNIDKQELSQKIEDRWARIQNVPFVANIN